MQRTVCQFVECNDLADDCVYLMNTKHTANSMHKVAGSGGDIDSYHVMVCVM